MVRGFFPVAAQLLILLIRVLDALHLGLTIAIGYHYLVIAFSDMNALLAVAGCVS